MESILQIDNLSKAFGDRIIFDALSLNINQGEKVGLIARNGQGKSTLLDVIAGNADYRSGSIVFRRDIKTAYLVQTPQFPQHSSVLDACCGSGADDETVLKARQLLTKLEVTNLDQPATIYEDAAIELAPGGEHTLVMAIQSVPEGANYQEIKT